jgi:hypothetical protein
VICRLKAGEVEPHQTSIARQRLGKDIPVAKNMQATIEGLLFLYNGEVNTAITIEDLLGNGVFCWGRPKAI